MLQNSKEEALNNAFKGDQHVGENNIVQELTKAILGEVKRMAGNDVCCDCGAPGEWPGNGQEGGSGERGRGIVLNHSQEEQSGSW